MNNSIYSVLEKKVKLEDYNLEETPYQINGMYIPRVTSILSNMLHEDGLMGWSNYLGFKRQSYDKVLSEAADKGTLVHNSIENYLQNNKNPDFSDSIYCTEVTNAFNAFLSWWNILTKNNQVEIAMEEAPLVGQYFAGTLDLLLKINGEYYLFDFKTSNHPSYKYYLQLSAYRYLLNELYGIKVSGVGILMLSKTDGTFNELFLHFKEAANVQFIDNCQEAFFSLVYAYYNRLKIEEQYKNIMKGL